MSEIDVVFGSVTDGDARRYVDQKVKAVVGGAGSKAKPTDSDTARMTAVARHVARILDEHAAGRQLTMPLHPAADMSGYSRDEQRLLKRQRAWFVTQVDRRFPLLDGEHVEPGGDFVSYLTQPCSGYPTGTVVLRRTTNRSVTYYVMREAQARPRQHRVVLVPLPPSARPRVRVADTGLHANAAGKTLADGLAGLLPAPCNVLGAALIALVWPSDAKASVDWAEVYENMHAILKTRLAAQSVSDAAGKVKGFIAFLGNEYVHLKADPKKTRRQILAALSEYDKPFFLEIVNVFMYADKPDLAVASESLANFVLGANLHIGLNQERALIDPDHPDDPGKSAYAVTAAALARTYSQYARAAAPCVRTLRMAQISDLEESERETYNRDGSVSCSWTYWFKDANNGYRSDDFHYSDIGNLCHKVNYKKAEKKKLDAKTALDEYRRKVAADTDAFLKTQVYDVADSWDRIARDPLPKTSA